MIIFIQELVLLFYLWVLKLIDGIMEIFSAIAGITNVDYQGNQVNIIEIIVGDSTINMIFWCIFILAIGLTCLFTIIALIKNMIVNNKNVSTIVGKFFLSLLGTLAMLSVVIIGIFIANAVLVLLSEIFQITNTTKLSNALFNACVEDWLNGYSITELNITDLSVHQIFGDYNTIAFGIWPTSWKCNGMVNPNTFLYLPALIASIAIAIALLVSVLNLAKRIYEIVFLYFVMPISVSTLSLDDGARFKIWRETFISKIVIAYGSLFSVNIFLLILPFIVNMKIEGVSGFGNAMFMLVMIIGGALVIPAGQILFVRLFGNNDDLHAGGGFFRSAMHTGSVAGMMALGVTSKMAFGTYRLGKKTLTSNKKPETKEKEESQKYTDEPAPTTINKGENE